MTSFNTFGVRFFLKKYKAINNCAPLYVRITVNKRSVDISLKRRIPLNKWNEKAGKLKSTTKEDHDIAEYLHHVSHQIFLSKEQLEKERKLVTALAVKNRFTGADEQSSSLLELIQYHNEEMKSELEWGTLKNYKTTQKYVSEFLKSKLGRSDIFLTELNYKFVVDFEKFLKSYKPKDHQKPCGQNTTMKHIERLRKMINLAIKIEWLDKDPFAKFSPKFNRTKRGYLNEEELSNIINKQFNCSRSEIFLFLAALQVFHMRKYMI